METPVAFGVLHQAVAVLVKLPAVDQIFVRTLGKVVLIDKVIACIVRQVYVRSQFNTKKKGHFRVHNAGKGSKIKAFEVIS